MCIFLKQIFHQHNFKKMAKLPIALPKKALANDLQLLEGALDRIVETTADVFADKKVSGSEYFQLFGHFGDVSVILTSFKPAWVQWKKLTVPEQDAEIENFAAGLDISSADARVRVQAIFTGGGAIYSGLLRAWSGVGKIHKAFSQRVSVSTPEGATPDPKNDVKAGKKK